MKVLGDKVYLDYPDIKENTLLVNPDEIKAYEAEQIAKLDRLTVFAVGEAITDKNSTLIQKGDQVYIDPAYFSTRGRAFFVEIEKAKKLVLPISQILHIW